ncbi:MAG: ribonuclease PH [Anaerofustis stercorihominis]|nr:ribonuclease PH [Anaerofustis stercorihominis]
MRTDRKNDQLRNISIKRNFLDNPQGSVLIQSGNTKVICTAFVEEKVPGFLRGQNKGWISAEYSMLPGANATRKQRDISKLKLDGRSAEIQRLIGRSLRSIVDLEKLGERTIWIDCDVINADGGTRTASITGSIVALRDALDKLLDQGLITEDPMPKYAAAVSVGVVDGEVLTDLCYSEDSHAEADVNVVMDEDGNFIELQATGEARPIKREEMDAIITHAQKAIFELIEMQKAAINKDKEKNTIIFATGNEHKAKELRRILPEYEILTLKDVNFDGDIVEDGNSFEENSLIKAKYIHSLYGKTVVADDSGVCVDLLNGLPGINSARYAGQHGNDHANNELLLKNIEGTSPEERTATFVSAAAVVFEDGSQAVMRGEVKGKIGYEYRGENGFGYDPLFIVDATGKTYAEMTDEEKNLLSHRKLAFEKLRPFIELYYNM